MWLYMNSSSCGPSIVVSLQESYRIAIQTEGMSKDLGQNLSSDNDKLQMHCASAIFKVPVLLVYALSLHMFRRGKKDTEFFLDFFVS